MKLLLIPFFSVIFFGASFAQDVTTPLPVKRGWHWYETKPKKEESKEEQTKPSLHDYKLTELWEMDTDKFQGILTSIQKEAVRKPTVESVKEYYVIQDIARKKALAYANTAGVVMQMYPELSLQRDIPNAVPGITARIKQQTQEIATKINQSSNDFALLYFHSPSCEYCVQQNQIVGLFESKYGWPVKKIDVTQNPDSAARFRVNGVPFLLLVAKSSKETMPISVGVVSLTDLEERIYRGVRLLKKDIRPDEYSLYDFQRGGGLDTAAPTTKDQER